MVELAGGVAMGLVSGWLLAQCLAVRPDRPATIAAGVGAGAAVVGEAAVIAGATAALGVVLAIGAGALCRIMFERAAISGTSR